MNLLKNMQTMSMDNNIYFFSYKGDIFEMPKGSSLVDFAYSLHTDFGNKLDFAYVNNKKQDISYKISEGDIIQLVKSKKQTK
jgi:GTP pyrophosphokinase